MSNRDGGSGSLGTLLAGAVIGAAGFAWWLYSEAERKQQQTRQQRSLRLSRLADHDDQTFDPNSESPVVREHELQDKVQQLNQAIEATETTTRQILSAEIEIARHQQASSGLEADAARLQKEQDSLRSRAEKLNAEHAGLVEERNLLRLEFEGLQQGHGDLQKEVDDLKKKVKKAEASNEKLTTEKESLESKLNALEENIKMMKQLKSDLMKSIQENMNELAGSE